MDPMLSSTLCVVYTHRDTERYKNKSLKGIPVDMSHIHKTYSVAWLHAYHALLSNKNEHNADKFNKSDISILSANFIGAYTIWFKFLVLDYLKQTTNNKKNGYVCLK